MLISAGSAALAQAPSDTLPMERPAAAAADKPDAATDESAGRADIGQPALRAADTANYVFSTGTSAALVDMGSGTTTLIGADQDDTASSVTAIGFDFFFQGVRYDRFSVNSNGTLRLGASAIGSTLYEPLAQAGQALITAYGADQRVRAGGGKVHFKVSGSAPDRVLTVEWLSMQSNFNAGGTADLTYQVRLSESSGVIEFIYGAMSMSAAGAADVNSSSPQIGFSWGNSAGAVGSVAAPQSGTPAPTFNGASASVASNLYVLGPIAVLNSAHNDARRNFVFTPPSAVAPGGPLTFSAVGASAMTLHWSDSPNDSGYLIYQSSDGVNYSVAGTVAENATSFTATGLLASTLYSWRVYAVTEGSGAFIAASQSTSAPVPNTAAAGLWSNPATWSTGQVPGGSDAVRIPVGVSVIVDVDATAYSLAVAGTLSFEQTTARTLNVLTDLHIDSGGSLQSSAAGSQASHNLFISRDLVNDGVLDLSTNADSAGAALAFGGAYDSRISGNGPTTDIRQISVNKSSGRSGLVELATASFSVRGAATDTVPGGWLALNSGTFRLSGSFPGSSRVFASANYVISASTGLWLDNPNYVIAAQAGSAVNNGLLRISRGTLEVGSSNANGLTGGAGAIFSIEGGSVNIAGRFNPSAAVIYNQSGGSFNVATQGNTSSGAANASFGLAGASVFNMSGGEINLVQASTGGIPVDYINSAGNLVAAAGTLRVGTAATATNFNFRLRGNVPNLIVDDSGGGKTATAGAQLNLLGTTTIRPGASLVFNGQTCQVLGTSIVNNGTLTGTTPGSRLYFLGGNGAATYSGSGVVTAPLATFEVDNAAGVTIAATAQPVVALRFNNFAGGLTNAHKLTLGNGGTSTAVVQLGVTGASQPVSGFDVPPVFDAGSGGVNLFYAPEPGGRSTGNEVPPSRTLNLLGISNPHDITLSGGDLTVNGTAAGSLALTGGRLLTGTDTLYLSAASTTVTRTTGYVVGNLRKAFAAAANKTFEVGTLNGYTPVGFNVTSGTFPADVRVGVAQTTAPGLQPAARALARYWTLQASGITADISLSYLDPADLPGALTESNLRFFRRGTRNPSDYTDQGGSIDTATNTASLSGVSSFSDWTLAESGADLAITLSDGVTTATPGASVTYTIVASNGGVGANPSALISDNFPDGLSCSTTCSGSGGASCTAGPFSGDINDTAGIPAGGAVIYTAVCAIDPGLSGTLGNTATISGGALLDFDTSNNSATDLTGLGAMADLSISKTDGVTTATPGGSVSYTITASNAGPSNATGATVTDTFPAMLTCSTTCVGAGGGTCTAGPFAGSIGDTVNLPVGASVTYTANCAISAFATGTLSNTASVTAPAGVSDPNPANGSATDTDTLAASADLSISKSNGTTTVTAGGSTTYVITAHNAGPGAVSGASVSDSFPAGLSCSTTCAGSGGGSCAAGPFAGSINDTVNLPAGSSVVYSANCTIASSVTGTLSNTASVAAPAGIADPAPGNESATDTDTVTLSADLSLSKTDGVTTATPGGSVTYTITARNAGPSDVSGASVSDVFASTLSCSWTCSGAGGSSCSAAGSGTIADTVNLPAGGSVSYTANCTIDAEATGTLSNTASVTAPGGVSDPNPGNESATDTDTLGASADLSISKTDGVTAATPGGTVVYIITAANAGPSTASGATVSDNFPATLSCSTTCVGAGGGSCSAGPFTGAINDTVNLPVGGSVTYTANCSISAATSGTLDNTATVTAPAGLTDPNPANNAALDSDTLGATADLSISKTDGVATATPGGSVIYTITARNAGPSDANGAIVTDTFPSTLICATTCVGSAGGSCTAGPFTGNINDTVNLPAGGSVAYTANCTISAAATGTLDNTATVTAPAGLSDTDPANNSALDSDTLSASADASISVSDGVASVNAGATLSYTVIAANAGPSALNPATVTDTFPAPLTACSWNCTAGSGGSCGNASGSGNLGDTPNLAPGGSVTYTATCSVPAATADGSVISNSASIGTGTASDPDPANNSASDSTRVIGLAPAGAVLSGTKTVSSSGSYLPGSTVNYVITLSNSGLGAQADNPGDEFSDNLPAGLSLLSASASAGVLTTTGNSVHWNGAVAAGASVTISIAARIGATASGVIANQGTLSFDADGNGSNEASAVTDDPRQAGTADPTRFSVARLAGDVRPVPGLGLLGTLLTLLGLAALALRRVALSR